MTSDPSGAGTAGFINGLAFPTAADLAIYNIAFGFMPFGAAFKNGAPDVSGYPKMKALADRVEASPEMAGYSKAALEANPMGF